MRCFPPKPSVGTECRYIVLFSRILFTLPIGVRLPGREQEININNDMKIKSLLRLGRVRWNTKKNTSDAKSCYDGMMYHCRKLSAYDHSYAFVFHRNALGWPIINQIERPEQIDLSDNDDKVVIRDGFIYSIKRTDKTSKE